MIDFFDFCSIIVINELPRRKLFYEFFYRGTFTVILFAILILSGCSKCDDNTKVISSNLGSTSIYSVYIYDDNNILSVEKIYEDNNLREILEYDLRGNIVSNEYYSDGKLDYKTVFQYTDNDILYLEKLYDCNMALDSEIKYNEKGKVISEKMYADEKVRYMYLYYYNNDDELIKTEGYDIEGILDFYSIREYDENYVIYKETYYNKNGEITEILDFNYGALRKQTYFVNNRIDYICEYDENENEIAYIYYDDKGNLKKVEKLDDKCRIDEIIFYKDNKIDYICKYDDEENEIGYIEYDSNEKVKNVVYY